MKPDELNDGLKALLGEDLAGFQIRVMTEIIEIASGSRPNKSLGLMSDNDLAEAYVETKSGRMVGDNHYSFERHIVLCDLTGGVPFFGTGPKMKYFENEDAEKAALKKMMIEKMPVAQRKLLGLDVDQK